MENPEFYNDPVQVTGTMNDQGQVNLQSLTWRGERYTIVALGRQWLEADGRHVMAEAADRTRFELQLSRQELIWYVRRVWGGQMVA